MADWVIRRPEWLRAKSARAFKRLEPPSEIANPNALAVARRSIDAFRRIALHDDEFVSAESIWDELRQTHYARLIRFMEQNDAAALANYQRQLFRTEAVKGFTYGTTFDAWPHRWNYLPVQIELSVVQLAEAVGIIRAECHATPLGIGGATLRKSTKRSPQGRQRDDGCEYPRVQVRTIRILLFCAEFINPSSMIADRSA